MMVVASVMLFAATMAGQGVPKIAPGDELGENLWMWGHDTGHYDGPVNYARHDYKIPWSAPITMPDACLDMGIPNCCVIRPGMPPPEDSYLPPYAKLKNISWLLWRSTKEYCLEKAVKIPNIAAFDLDDFFHAETIVDEKPDGTKVKCRSAVMTLKEIDATRKELSERAGHPVELRMVLYVHQLEPNIVPAVEMMDKILLWTWDGKDVASMDENVRKFRSYCPDKPILLGLYMWDFGGHKPIEREFMQSQLDLAERLYKEGTVEGLIFHCTPLVNKGLEAVDMSRKWIAAHRHDRYASEPKSEIALVDHGRADCEVVVDPSAGKPGGFGASELAKYLAKTTGCGELKGGRQIRISVDPARPGLIEDGFEIAVDRNGVSITGQNRRGALYGCYELLKRYAGTRWLVPGEDGEYVASMTSVILPFGKFVKNPRLVERQNRSGDYATALWNVRNGLHACVSPFRFVNRKGEFDAKGYEKYEELAALAGGNGGHVMSDLLLGGRKVDEVFAEHPEWFPLVDGKRVKISGAGDPNPCFSNPALIEHMAEVYCRTIERIPHWGEGDHVTIGNNDTTIWCQCDECRKLDIPERAGTKGELSDRYWYAVNAIARKVWAKHPEVKLGGWAYQNFWYPPAVVKVDPRLRVLVSYNNQCWKHPVDDPKCPVNAEWRKIMAAWKATGHPLVVNRDEISASDSPGQTWEPVEKAVWDDIFAYPKHGCRGSHFCVDGPFPEFQQWHAKAYPFYGRNYRWYTMWLVNYLAAAAESGARYEDYSMLSTEAQVLYYGAGYQSWAKANWTRQTAFEKGSGCFGWGQGSQLGSCLYNTPWAKTNIIDQLERAIEKCRKAGDIRSQKHIERDLELFNITWVKRYEDYAENYCVYEVAAKKGEIAVDGVLDEEDWKNAAVLDRARVAPWMRKKSADGIEEKPPKLLVRMLHSPDTLYFAVEAMESEMDRLVALKEIDPAHPWKNFGDHLEFFYQYPDMAEKCYHLMLNSEGQFFSGLQVTPANFDGSFRSKAKYALRKYADRYVAELAVPTSEIGMQCFPGASWKANVGRTRVREGAKPLCYSVSGGNFNGVGTFVNLKFLP